MKVNVRGKNIEVTNALKEYVEKKLSKLEKYFDHITEAQVTLTVEKGRHIVEVTVPLNGIILRGEEKQEDMYASVDLVLEKLEKQVQKYKTRINRRLRQNGQSREYVPTEVEVYDDEPKVVKMKRFAFKPMDVEEAMMQMNLVGHDFFVFSNSDTDEVNVLYRRKDGDYGLIEPEF